MSVRCGISRGALHPECRRLHIVLGVANRGCTGGTHGDQVVVADFPDVARAQGDQRLGATRCGHEFHLHGIGRVDINDSAHIATLQRLSGKVRVQDNDIKRLKTYVA